MKKIFILFVLPFMLFAGQKQIILGSYSVESNGERALETFKTQIDEDLQLQGFMQEYNLRTINTVISEYIVVSLNAFDSYTKLLNTLIVLKRYYPDAYVLKYPTKNIEDAETFSDVEAKAKIEEQQKIEEITVAKVLEEAFDESADTGSELIVVPVAKKIEEVHTVHNSSVKEVKKETLQTQEYVYYLLGFALFALVAAGVTVMIISSNKKKTQEKNV